jgi:hypothetical protein
VEWCKKRSEGEVLYYNKLEGNRPEQTLRLITKKGATEAIQIDERRGQCIISAPECTLSESGIPSIKASSLSIPLILSSKGLNLPTKLGSFAFKDNLSSVSLDSFDLQFNPKTNFAMDVQNFEMEHFELGVEGDLKANIEVTLTFNSENKPGYIKYDLPLLRWVSPNYPIPQAPFIFLKVIAETGFGVNAHFNHGNYALKLGGAIDVSLMAGAEYTEGEWKPVSKHRLTVKPNSQLQTGSSTLGYDARVYLFQKLTVIVNNFAGPYIVTKEYIGQIDDGQEPKKDIVGIKAAAGGTLDFWIKNWLCFRTDSSLLDNELTIIDKMNDVTE